MKGQTRRQLFFGLLYIELGVEFPSERGPIERGTPIAGVEFPSERGTPIAGVEFPSERGPIEHGTLIADVEFPSERGPQRAWHANCRCGIP